MLLPEHSADELAEHGQEIGEGTSGTLQLLDVTPRDFDSHVVVAPGVASMRKAESAALTRPKVTTPIGTLVAVPLPEIIIHEQGLRPISESHHADVANADQDVVKVVVSFPTRTREVLEMRIICGGDCCQKEINLEKERIHTGFFHCFTAFFSKIYHIFQQTL